MFSSYCATLSAPLPFSAAVSTVISHLKMNYNCDGLEAEEKGKRGKRLKKETEEKVDMEVRDNDEEIRTHFIE